VLDGLEKELRAVKKAREALGDRAPALSKGGWGPRSDGGVLGKRRRGGEDASSSEEDVDEDVKRIPMPRDTPPPIPKEVLDEWYAKRRARRAAQNPNDTPLGGEKKTQAPVEAKTVYEAAPVVRDLKKEAVTAFVPTSVRMKMSKGKGEGGLMEPEEADRLEREGYLKMRKEEDDGGEQGSGKNATVEDAEDEE
jgi:hypothetical protein